MNEIENYQSQLPEIPEELVKFTILKQGQAKHIMEGVKALERIPEAKWLYKQKLEEAQEVNEIAMAAAVKLGELLLEIPKQSGRPSNNFSSRGEKLKTKAEITSGMGLTRNEVDQFQRLARNPDVVKSVLQDEFEKGNIVSTSQMSRKIREIEQRQKELERQLAEKDRKISELENRKPEIREIEVVPPDYEDMKRSVENYKKESVRIQQEKKKASEKNAELRERIRDLESRKDIDALQKKVQEEAGYFAIRTYKYVQENGGCVWLFQKIDELSDKERKNFVDAILSLHGFAERMIKNLEEYGIE